MAQQLISILQCTSPRTSEANERNSNERYLPNLNGQRIYNKKFDGSGIAPDHFPALFKMVIFSPFSQYSYTGGRGSISKQSYRSIGIEKTTTLLFILKVLQCSYNLMQKMTSITPIYKISHFLDNPKYARVLLYWGQR